MLIAVAPNKTAYGAESTDDWRIAPGQPGNDREIISRRTGLVAQVGVTSPYIVTDLGNAMLAHHKTDAHLVSYVLRGRDGGTSPKQPRLTKDALPWVLSLGFDVSIDCLFADVDNPNHDPWDDHWRTEAERVDAQLSTCGIYYTNHGRRLVQPLKSRVRVPEAENVLAGWLRWLSTVGVHADPSCQDWTRHFRLPYVRREGKLTAPIHVDFGRMAPIVPPEPAPIIGKRFPRRIHRGSTGPVNECGLARALEVAGMLGNSVGPKKRVMKCPFASSHSTGVDLDSSTVLFGATKRFPNGWIHCSHGHCTARSQEEFIEALPVSVRAALPRPEDAPAPEARELVTPGVARNRLEDAFRSAPDGLSSVAAGCGTGKTEAAVNVAGERSAKLHASPTSTGARAPSHSKTAISVPTSKLALEVCQRAREKLIPTKRLFGVLSARNEDGSPVCRYHETATALAAGGLSVPWELCEGRGRHPCTYAEDCTARGGSDGPDDARLIVGPHAMMSRLDGAAGSTGLMVVDEPPPMLVDHSISPTEIDDAIASLSKFAWRYAAGLMPALAAVAKWVRFAEPDKATRLAQVVTHVDEAAMNDAYQATGETDAIEAARAAVDPKATSDAPPVDLQWINISISSVRMAREVGNAMRVCRIVRLALIDTANNAIARIEEIGDARSLVITLPDEQFVSTLRREGSIVVADAGVRHNIALYARVVGYDPPVTEAHAADGAEVKRTIWLVRGSGRAAWIPEPFRLTDGARRCLDHVTAWLRERPPKTWAIVTFQQIKLALAAALGHDVSAPWRWGTEALDRAKLELAPIVAAWPSPPDLGHYGAVRGLDHWRDHEALVTFGDPWGQLDRARWEATYVGVVDWESRMQEAAELELEQAQGRLRVVHRTSPARALHVGRLWPTGWSVAGGVEVREDRGGHRGHIDRDAAMAAIAKHGSQRKAAEALGTTRGSIIRALGGSVLTT